MLNQWNFRQTVQKRVPISVVIVFIPSFLTVAHISKWRDGARQTEIFSCLENINSPGTFPDFLLSSFLLHHLSERGNNQPENCLQMWKSSNSFGQTPLSPRVFYSAVERRHFAEADRRAARALGTHSYWVSFRFVLCVGGRGFAHKTNTVLAWFLNQLNEFRLLVY